MLDRFPSSTIATALVFVACSAAHAQQPLSENMPEFLTQVDGAITPELIDTDIVYLHLSNILVRYGPTVCSPGVEDTLPVGVYSASDTPFPCVELDGIEPEQAETLGRRYLDAVRILDSTSRSQLCSNERFLRNLAIPALAQFLDNTEAAFKLQKVDFFNARGRELLGDAALEALIKWADENVRPGMVQVKTDTRVMLEGQILDVETFFDEGCGSF